LVLLQLPWAKQEGGQGKFFHDTALFDPALRYAARVWSTKRPRTEGPTPATRAACLPRMGFKVHHPL
jgi:hypothetical protein